MGYDPSAHFTQVEERNKRLLSLDWTPGTDRYYCLYCIFDSPSGDGWTGSYAVKQHVQIRHDVPTGEQGRGVDWTDGEGLWLALHAFHSHCEEVARKNLGDKLKFCLDVEDFLDYCKAGV